MLAVGRGLMLQPRLRMLDEPSLGLAPVMTDATFQKIQEIHAMGTAILLVEQNVSRALSLVQRAYVLESGKVIMQEQAPSWLTTGRCRRPISVYESAETVRKVAVRSEIRGNSGHISKADFKFAISVSRENV